LLVTFACIALAIAAGCGGGGSSSSGGGGGGTVPVVTPTPSPTPTTTGQSQSRTLALSPATPPATASFSPMPLTGIGTSVVAVTAPVSATSTTVTLTTQTTLPAGVATPSSVARAPKEIGGQNIVPLVYISATSATQAQLSASPSFAISFTNALASSYDYIYVAQYSASGGGGWSTISVGTVGSGRTSAMFPAFGEQLTLNSTKTWFLIFTAQNSLASPTPAPNPTGVATSAPSSAPVGATPAPLPDALQFTPNGFYGEEIASGLPAPRQLVALPNGDLLAGTDDKSGTVWIIPNTEVAPGAAVGTPHVFATVPSVTAQEPAQGLAFDPTTSMIYIATNQSVWQVHYTTGDTTESTSAMVEIAKVRRGSISPTTDGDVHFTSSVAVVPGHTLYVGVGSSCNACVETDPTRGTIQQVDLTSPSKTQSLKAARFRNALAMTVNPATNTLWAGGAGQDDLIQLNGSIVIGSQSGNPTGFGHPYEFFDPVTAHTEAMPDYGWPMCEENNHVYNPLGASPANCNSTVVNGALDVQPRVELWAYSTIIGATFYPSTPGACTTYEFPTTYRGDAFLSMHGSWHENPSGIPLAPPQLIYVPMTGDTPTIAANYSNSSVQWQNMIYGFQDPSTGNRIGRPVGLAVGKCGSLFVSDDYAGVIYRIRPGTAPASIHRRAR
jgi:glucose/arabinose dehydrogenase